MSGEFKRPWDRTRRVLGPVVAPFYGAAVGRLNWKYDHGGLVRRRAGIPVISVGNLTMGGTGKTPMTAWLCRQLGERGVQPMIAMRGYKGDGQIPSDEAEEYRRLLPGVPLAVNPDRFAGIAAALRDGARADVVILDDGFQHRRLHRDMDIVLLDGSRDVFAERMFPAGDLREPLRSLQRADVLVLTHAERLDPLRLADLRGQLSAFVGNAPLVLAAKHEWTGVAIFQGEREEVQPLSWLVGKRAVVVCAIGAPQQFVERVRQSCEVVGAVVRPDHDGYTQADIDEVRDLVRRCTAEVVVMTEKDWSKLGRLPPEVWPCPVARPRLEMQVEDGDRLLGAVMRLLPGQH